MPLWYDLEDPEKYVYHYTTRQAALGAILLKGEVRLGLYRHMNDPREAKDWLFTIEGGTVESAEAVLELSREATRLAKATSKVLALTCDDPASPGTGFGEFGRGYAHSALWAHYGGAHSGVCLVFERDALRVAIEDALLSKGRLYEGRVEYADAPGDEIEAFTLSADVINDVGLERAIEDHVALWHPVLFFRKSREWENEREYRWLLRSPDPVPEVVSISSAIRAVVVGHDFPNTDRDSLDYFKERFSGLETATCRWDNGVPKIIPHGMPTGSIVINTRFRVSGSPRPAPPPSLEVRERGHRAKPTGK
jgi:hypothetical protein